MWRQSDTKNSDCHPDNGIGKQPIRILYLQLGNGNFRNPGMRPWQAIARSLIPFLSSGITILTDIMVWKALSDPPVQSLIERNLENRL